MSVLSFSIFLLSLATTPATWTTDEFAGDAASSGVTVESGQLIMPVDEFEGEWEQEGFDIGSWEAGEDARGGVSGSLLLGYIFPPMGQVNRIAADLGFPGDDGNAFGGGPLQMGGIRVTGNVGRHFRVGGYFATGGKTLRGDTGDFRRELAFDVQHTGLTLEIVYPRRRWEVYAGGLLGSATLTYTYRQVDSERSEERVAWDEVVDELAAPSQTATFRKTVENSFLMAMPWVGGRFKVAPWFAIDANVGYQFGSARGSQWSYSDTVYSLGDAPSVSFHGLSTRLEAVFGFFPY